jgi:hypothetical protein
MAASISPRTFMAAITNICRILDQKNFGEGLHSWKKTIADAKTNSYISCFLAVQFYQMKDRSRTMLRSGINLSDD